MKQCENGACNMYQKYRLTITIKIKMDIKYAYGH